MKPDPREERLPKWAQGEIRALRAEIRDLRRRIDDLPFGDDTTAVTGFYDEHPRPVAGGPYGEVWFLLGQTGRAGVEHGRDWISARVRGGALQVYGDRALVIKPAVTNSIVLGLSS